MTKKEIKNKILEKYKSQEERIFVSNLIDKAYKYETYGKIEYTNFLNLNEQKIAVSILNELNIDYKIFSFKDRLVKKVIFFVPEYIEMNNDFFNDYISCLKITAKSCNKLKHKDYMGAIYSLGIKHEVIGDIFVKENCGYVFLLKNVAEYLLLNLFKVGNEEVTLKEICFSSKELEKISYNLEEKEIIAASLRVDAVLSVIYKKSRNEIKEKITKGDLYINDKEERFLSYNLKEGDIVSFRKCGKLQIGKVIRKTRSDRVAILVNIYV